MKTITITFDVNNAELDLLRMAHADQPDPHRVKLMLLSSAASALRRMSEDVMKHANAEANRHWLDRGNVSNIKTK